MNPLYPIKYIFYLRTLNKKSTISIPEKKSCFFYEPHCHAATIATRCDATHDDDGNVDESDCDAGEDDYGDDNYDGHHGDDARGDEEDGGNP